MTEERRPGRRPDIAWSPADLSECLEAWIARDAPTESEARAVADWCLNSLAVDPFGSNARPFGRFGLECPLARVPIRLGTNGDRRAMAVVRLNFEQGVMTFVTLAELSAPFVDDEPSGEDETEYDPWGD